MKEPRILLVDDEALVRETLGEVLSDEGYLVDLAADGETALMRLQAARPDAILLDLLMPGMNGRQFLQVLRDEPAYANVPVLLMTAVHGLELTPVALGATDVVEKPLDMDALLNKIALAVYRSRDDEPLPASPAPVRVDDPTWLEGDRGVVVVIERDRGRLSNLDQLLSWRGYTVVALTRALVPLALLARALKPRAILIDASSEGFEHAIAELQAAALGMAPILVFARDPIGQPLWSVPTLERAGDDDLIEFVERQV